jgi:hypothetical protein
MTQLKAEWQKVFKYAVAVAKDSCKKNPNLKYSEAMKRAWKDPRVMAKRREYEKKRDAIKAKPKKPTTKKPAKKPTVKKPKPAVKKPKPAVKKPKATLTKKK